MKNGAPLISVIVPCFNQAQYLPEALESVLKQTFQNWECVIVNDGSLDNTKEVAKEWLRMDSRFKYIEQENKGLSGARNAGIEFAKGEYILPLDADDKISDDYLALAINEFQIPPPPKVVYCRAELFGERNGEWLLKEYSFKNLLIDNMIFCSSFFKKKDWSRVAGFDENMKFGLEDWEFWINILKNGGQVKKINKTCFFYRIKERSMLKEMNDSNKRDHLNYVYKKHIDSYFKYHESFVLLKKNELILYELLKSKRNAVNVLSDFLFGYRLFK